MAGYRSLTLREVRLLLKQRNIASSWKDIYVKDPFDCGLIWDNRFSGEVRIGSLKQRKEGPSLCGIYRTFVNNSQLGSSIYCDHVGLLSHYEVGDNVVLSHVDEISFKKMKDLWVDIRNENGKRKILLTPPMTLMDIAFKERSLMDHEILRRLDAFSVETLRKNNLSRGKIGSGTIVKSSHILRDTLLGDGILVEGCGRIENSYIEGGKTERTLLEEVTSLKNSYVKQGCYLGKGIVTDKSFIDKKSTLDQGARVSHAVVGAWSLMTCGEMRNVLLYPYHEQHHNSSFLCSAFVRGQSNIASGANIGSNHNGRMYDGEMVAGRGFWPGLCVSIKYDSHFSSFNLLSKGAYPHEINNPFPFSLLAYNEKERELQIIPAYQFLYNMYALQRGKIKRKSQRERGSVESDYLAPDTIEEIWEATKRLEGEISATTPTEAETLLDKEGELLLEGLQKGKEKTRLRKVGASYRWYRKMIHYYAVRTLLHYLEETASKGNILSSHTPREGVDRWINLGGELFTERDWQQWRKRVLEGQVKQWDDLHYLYAQARRQQEKNRAHHALSLLLRLEGGPSPLPEERWNALLEESAQIGEEIIASTYQSREKDYEDPFRRVTYNTPEEQTYVLGALEKDPYLEATREEVNLFQEKIARHKKYGANP